LRLYTRFVEADIERINAPGLTLIALADYFGVSFDYLVGRSDDPEKR
jgi:hypothetical protein